MGGPSFQSTHSVGEISNNLSSFAEQSTTMNTSSHDGRAVIETFACDQTFAEDYLCQIFKREQAAAPSTDSWHRQALAEGIADADAGKLTELDTISQKWRHSK